MPSVEQRISALEAELRAVKQQLTQQTPSRSWVLDVAGAMDEWPEHEEVLRLGRQFREGAGANETDSPKR